MPTPQLPGFGDVGAFIRWTKSIDYRINLLFEKLNNVLANTGLSVPSPGVTQVDGTFNVLGTENVSGNLNVTGSATIGGATTISGATTVSGTNGIESSNYAAGASGWKLDGTQVEINTGAVGMSALVHPISFDGNGGAVSNFALSTSSTIIASVTNTVPAGMTKMASFAVGNVDAVNSTASLDYLQCSVGITGPTGTHYNGNSMFQPVSASGGSGHVSASKYGVLTGLTAGQTITHYVSVWASSAAWAANASNLADIQAMVLWGA